LSFLKRNIKSDRFDKIVRNNFEQRFSAGPKGESQDETSNLPQVRVKRKRNSVALATARRASEASHPARPTHIAERRPEGASLLYVILFSNFYPERADNLLSILIKALS